MHMNIKLSRNITIIGMDTILCAVIKMCFNRVHILESNFIYNLE